MTGFNGRTVLVTGASGGIGGATVRHLVDAGAAAPGRIAAVGFGSARPLADGDAPEVLATNRRVDVVVLSDEAEAVRALIPGIIAET